MMLFNSDHFGTMVLFICSFLCGCISPVVTPRTVEVIQTAANDVSFLLFQPKIISVLVNTRLSDARMTGSLILDLSSREIISCANQKVMHRRMKMMFV